MRKRWGAVTGLAQLFIRHRRRSDLARVRLQQAYAAVFSNNATTEDAQLVYVDIANFTGFYKVCGPQVSDVARAYADGQRSVFARVNKFMQLTEAEERLVHTVARAEAITDAEEGFIP